MLSTKMLAIALAAAALAGASPARAQTASEPTTTPAAPEPETTPAPAAPATTSSTTTTRQDGTATTVETTTVQAPPAAPVVTHEERIPQLDERTAFMVGRNTLKLGIIAFEYGILRRLSVGSDPPAWAARAFVDVWVPNVHLKYQIVDRDPVWVAVLGSAYYARLSGGQNVGGDLIDVPLSVFATAKVHPRVYLHGEATYIFARLFGSGDLTRVQFNGSAPLRAGQLGLIGQLRISRVVSLVATGRYQVYAASIPFDATSTSDPYTTATAMGQLTPAFRHPWEVIGGVALLWKHFHLIAGGGYGYYFIPGLDIPNSSRTFVPDLSLAVYL
jgi:hypothetical protein